VTWQRRARCEGKATREHDPWYPPEDDKGDVDYSEANTMVARAECWACPVREMCLEYAIDTGQQHGIWGGLDPDERRKLVLDRALADS